MRTLVIGPRGVGKTTFCKSLAAEQSSAFLNMDLARQHGSPLACASIQGAEGEPQGFMFVGCLAPHRDPLNSMAALAQSMQENLVVELPLSSVSAVAVHFMRALVETLAPERIISVGFENSQDSLQPPPHVQLEYRAPASGAVAMPTAAEAAWRKAHWKSTFEGAVKRLIPVERISNARLGCGVRLTSREMEEVRAIGLESAVYGEVIGSTLYLVLSGRAEPDAVSGACRSFDCSHVHLVHPRTFEGLICCLESQTSVHTAIGRIVEFSSSGITVQSLQHGFDSLWRLRLGRLRLDSTFDELGEIRAWQV